MRSRAQNIGKRPGSNPGCGEELPCQLWASPRLGLPLGEVSARACRPWWVRPGPTWRLGSFLAPLGIHTPLSAYLSWRGGEGRYGEKVRPDSGRDLGQDGWLSSWSGSLSSCANLRQGLGEAWHYFKELGESKCEIPASTSMGPVQCQALVRVGLGHKHDPSPNSTHWSSWPVVGMNGLQ